MAKRLMFEFYEGDIAVDQREEKLERVFLRVFTDSIADSDAAYLADKLRAWMDLAVTDNSCRHSENECCTLYCITVTVCTQE